MANETPFFFNANARELQEAVINELKDNPDGNLGDNETILKTLYGYLIEEEFYKGIVPKAAALFIYNKKKNRSPYFLHSSYLNEEEDLSLTQTIIMGIFTKLKEYDPKQPFINFVKLLIQNACQQAWDADLDAKTGTTVDIRRNFAKNTKDPDALTETQKRHLNQQFQGFVNLDDTVPGSEGDMPIKDIIPDQTASETDQFKNSIIEKILFYLEQDDYPEDENNPRSKQHSLKLENRIRRKKKYLQDYLKSFGITAKNISDLDAKELEILFPISKIPTA